MPMTLQDVEHVAGLSKLELADDEKQRATVKLAAIIDYVQQLQEADISNVEPTINVLALENVFREDALIPCLPREQALALAPDSEGGFFKVPSIL